MWNPKVDLSKAEEQWLSSLEKMREAGKWRELGHRYKVRIGRMNVGFLLYSQVTMVGNIEQKLDMVVDTCNPST